MAPPTLGQRILEKFLSPFVLVTLLICGGLGALLAGYLIVDHHPQRSHFLITVGTTILASGVFTATVKLFQFGGIFADELRKVLNEWEASHQRPELERAWIRRTALVLNWFPHAQAAAEALGVLVGIDGEKDCYYEPCSFEYIIRSFDPVTGNFVISETSDLHVRVSGPTIKVPLRFKWQAKRHSGQTIRVESLTVNGTKQTLRVQESDAGSDQIVSYELDLTGLNDYHVVRRTTRHGSIQIEPYVRLMFQRIAKNVTVIVSGDLQELDVSLLSVGTSDEFSDLLQDGAGNEKRMTYSKTVFPRQGFMLIMRARRPEEREISLPAS